MHYYQFNIADYRSATVHLSNEEDLAYRRLLDMYYDTEQKIPLDTQWVARRLRVQTEVVCNVLNDMFEQHEDGYFHARCDVVIKQFKQFAEAGKRGAAKRWGTPPDGEVISPPNATPMLTNNYKPITNNQLKEKQRGSRLAHDWVLTKSLGEWAQAERPDLNIRQIAEQFKDYWIAQPGQKGVKLDWSATWRNWVRNSKASKPNVVDIARVTVPMSNTPDPALEKIKADEKTTRPPTQAEREMLASLKRKS
jgi:uncharacterized protein YdaU (DUF1376 family)